MLVRLRRGDSNNSTGYGRDFLCLDRLKRTLKPSKQFSIGFGTGFDLNIELGFQIELDLEIGSSFNAFVSRNDMIF